MQQEPTIANCCGNSRKTPMLLLALDTSTRQASIALCSEDELRGEYTWHVGNNHSVELLDRISRLLAECGNSMQDIDGVAVATGPGSRSEEHTSELQSRVDLVCRLLLEKKNKKTQ